MQRNSIYDDYRRRRVREKWFKRLPLLLAIVVVIGVIAVIVSVAVSQSQRQVEQPEVAAMPSPQVTMVASATPAMAAVVPTATAEPAVTPLSATATASPTQTPLATEVNETATPHPEPPAGGGKPLPSGEGSQSFYVPALQRLMLDLINRDRQANGLSPVEWDESAAQAAMAHAEDMAAQNYFSHWNTQGWGPDVRYGLAGGTDVIRENVAAQWRRYDDGRPAPIDDWPALIRDVQAGLMNSPGHRANILDPHHTHVGVGIGYNAQTGETRIAQEFINRYVQLAPAVNSGNVVALSGTLLNGASKPLVNVAVEPLPKPLTPDDLNNRMPRTYQSPAENIAVVRMEMQANDRFTARVPLGQNGAGLYHIRIWVNVNGEQVPAANVLIAMDKP